MKDEELAELLRKIRKINRMCLKGEITGEQRVRMHNDLVPGIGNLEGVTKGLGKESERRVL